MPNAEARGHPWTDGVSASPTAWILPLLDAQMRRAAVPAAARAAVLAQATSLVAGSTCRLSARVDVRFLRAGLEDFSLAWEPTAAGAPSLRLAANLDDTRAVASYRIVPSFSCGGSTANPVHAVLTTLLPGTFRSVFAIGGSLTLHTALRADGQRIVGANELSLDLDGARIAPPFDWVPADAWSALLTSLQVTPEGLATAARPQVERALEPIGAQVAEGLTQALALGSDERVGSIRVVDGEGGRELSVYVPRPTPLPATPTCQTTITGSRICR